MSVVPNGRRRRAFVMRVNPGQEVEYQKRHTPIWPELEEVLTAHGVRNYSIFLDPRTDLLFAYVEFENEDEWQAIAQTEACKRWWAHMKDIMPTNADDSPVQHELCEVFHLDTHAPAHRRFPDRAARDQAAERLD
jgi:L-rhamnose mutarotase